jgi:hypothetical protein
MITMSITNVEYPEADYQQWLRDHYVPIAGGWHY